MATQITATLPTLNFPKEVDYPTQEDWAAFSAAAELNFGILGGGWSTQMQLWKNEANAMSIELNTNTTIAQGLADYQGDWTSKGYSLGQTVSIGGVYYICKLAHATEQNPTSGGSIYWNLALGNWSLKVDTNMSGYTAKTILADADLLSLSDSASSFGIKKLSWKNLKANLNTGFKNLIVNGRKQVNQSGLTTKDNAYNYDNHYKVGNNWFMFIDGKNIISGESYTVSWEGAATAGYYIGTAGALTINAQTFTPIGEGETITPTISSSQILWIKFASDASGSTYNNVQFEPGVVATPYEQRLYELEEILTQSCYEIMTISVGGYNLAGYYLRIRPKYTVVKREIPILTLGAFTDGSNITAGTFIVDSSTTESFRANAQVNATGDARGTQIVTIDARPY